MTTNAFFETEGTYTPDCLINSNTGLLQGATVTIAAGAALLRGSVLGKISASGKYALSATNIEGAPVTDGSQTPVAVLGEDVDATAGDVKAVAYTRGDFLAAGLVFGTGQTVATTEDALRMNGIFILQSVA